MLAEYSQQTTQLNEDTKATNTQIEKCAEAKEESEKPAVIEPVEIIIARELATIPIANINPNGEFALILKTFLSLYPHFNTYLEQTLINHINPINHLFDTKQLLQILINRLQDNVKIIFDTCSSIILPSDQSRGYLASLEATCDALSHITNHMSQADIKKVTDMLMPLICNETLFIYFRYYSSSAILLLSKVLENASQDNAIYAIEKFQLNIKDFAKYKPVYPLTHDLNMLIKLIDKHSITVSAPMNYFFLTIKTHYLNSGLVAASPASSFTREIRQSPLLKLQCDLYGKSEKAQNRAIDTLTEEWLITDPKLAESTLINAENYLETCHKDMIIEKLISRLNNDPDEQLKFRIHRVLNAYAATPSFDKKEKLKIANEYIEKIKNFENDSYMEALANINALMPDECKLTLCKLAFEALERNYKARSVIKLLCVLSQNMDCTQLGYSLMPYFTLACSLYVPLEKMNAQTTKMLQRLSELTDSMPTVVACLDGSNDLAKVVGAYLGLDEPSVYYRKFAVF